MPDAPVSVLPLPSAGGAPTAPVSVLASPGSGGDPASPLSILATPGAAGAPTAPLSILAVPGAGGSPTAPVSILAMPGAGGSPTAPASILGLAAPSGRYLKIALSGSPSGGSGVMVVTETGPWPVNGTYNTGYTLAVTNGSSPSVWGLEVAAYLESLLGDEDVTITFDADEIRITPVPDDPGFSPTIVVMNGAGTTGITTTSAEIAGGVESPAAVLATGFGGTPSILNISGMLAGPPDGLWMNGSYQRADDVNGYPAWERIVGNQKSLIECGDPEAPWYYIDVWTRASSESAWTGVGTMFAPNSSGYPWEITWTEDGSYFGSPVCSIESYALPPASVLA